MKDRTVPWAVYVLESNKLAQARDLLYSALAVFETEDPQVRENVKAKIEGFLEGL